MENKIEREMEKETENKNIEIGTENIEIGTENIEVGTENIEIGTENIEVGTENIEIGTENIEAENKNMPDRKKEAGTEIAVKALNEKNVDTIIEGIDIVRTFLMGEVEVRVLRGISVKIRRGEFVAIMGPSGSGKTTLLNQLGLLDTPNSGKVIINGADTSLMFDREKGRFRLHNLGYVFQDYALLPELTASENVYISLMMQGKSKAEYESAAAKIMEAVGLGDRLSQLPSKMSGGQQQRVSIARALAHNPIILFADEPCANLDSKNSKEVLDLFKKFNKELGQTIVMVTHEDWHAEYTDRVIRLKDGMLE